MIMIGCETSLLVVIKKKGRGEEQHPIDIGPRNRENGLLFYNRELPKREKLPFKELLEFNSFPSRT